MTCQYAHPNVFRLPFSLKKRRGRWVSNLGLYLHAPRREYRRCQGWHRVRKPPNPIAFPTTLVGRTSVYINELPPTLTLRIYPKTTFVLISERSREAIRGVYWLVLIVKSTNISHPPSHLLFRELSPQYWRYATPHSARNRQRPFPTEGRVAAPNARPRLRGRIWTGSSRHAPRAWGRGGVSPPGRGDRGLRWK